MCHEKIRFETKTDEFHGVFWPTKVKSEAVMIAMLGDDAEDYMVKCCVKWFHKFGVNVMSMSPNKKDYGHHNYPLERIEKAILWLKEYGTHFVFPEGMIKQMIPFGSSLLIKLCFKAAKQHPKECLETRIDIEKRVGNAISEWRC